MGLSLSKSWKPRPRARRSEARANSVKNGWFSDHIGPDKAYSDPEARDDLHSFPLDEVQLSSLSDEQLLKVFCNAPKLHQLGAVTIVRLSKSLVCKSGEGVFPNESQNMKLAAETLHLRVPKVHRAFMAEYHEYGEQKPPVMAYFIVMDYLPGPTVGELWASMTVTDQVAAMVEKMQSTPLDLPPGPVGWTGTDLFMGPWFTEDGAGPFASLKYLENWHNHKIDVSVRFQQLKKSFPKFNYNTVVLTNQDIAPRNLILDSQGKVWMIDWGFGGAYPPGFEQAILDKQCFWSKGFTGMVLSKLSNQQEHITKQFQSIGYGLGAAARI